MTRTATAAIAQRALKRGRTGATAARRRVTTFSCGVTGQSIRPARPESIASSSAGSGIHRLLDSLAQPLERARQPRLHGSLRDAERGRGLLAAELEEVPARDNKPVVVVEVVDESQEPLPLVRRQDRRLGGWGRIPRAEVLRQAKVQVLATSRRARAVARLVGDDAQQPRPGLRARAEGVQGPVGLEHALLRGVLRLGGGSGDDVGDPERDLLVPLHNLLKGTLIAALRACEKFGFVRWTALHRIGSTTNGAGSRFRSLATRAALYVLRESDGRRRTRL